MNDQTTLWQQLEKVAINKVAIMKKRSSLLLHENEFDKFKEYFNYQVTFFKNNGQRTKHVLKHLHAKKHGQIYEIHIDHGNPARFILLSLLHNTLDVIPFILYCFIKYKKYYFSPFSLHKNDSFSSSK